MHHRARQVSFGIISVGIISLLLWGLLPLFPCLKDSIARTKILPPETIPYLTDVRNSTVYQYGARDTQNRGLDCLNIFEYQLNQYYGVHHTWNGTSFTVNLVFSSDLQTWTFITALVFEASMPVLRFRAVQKDFFLIHEQWQNPNCSGPCRLKIQYFQNLSELISARPTAIYQMPQSFSMYEGTPNIYYISENADQIDIGFHFLHSEGRDQVANGSITHFLTPNPEWTTKVWDSYNQRLTCLGCEGSIGGREYGSINNTMISLQEGQMIKDNWSTWNIWMYHWPEDTFIPVKIQTHQNSIAFCNPHFSVVHDPKDPNRLGVFTSYFIPSEGAALGEAGELFFFTPLR